MRFALKDYQTDAVGQVLANLADAREDYRRKNRLIAFALSATTGAGKTVMATAVLEALFEGSEEFDVEPDPGAVVLWVTDSPSLNEQTRLRIMQSGDRLAVSQLNVIGDGGFDQETFDPGNVYFLNVQKLRSDTTWVTRSDKRTYSLWDTIRNTIEDDRRTLYLILDEAHKGMGDRPARVREERERSTIVQRLINGHDGIPPAPIVWGISATVERFVDAMTAAQSEGRTTYPAVQVDPQRVQESGLLKDTILLDFPDEPGAFATTLLRGAISELRMSSTLWAEYAELEATPDPVVPLMVLQVPNTPKESDLSRRLDLIHEEWPDLGADGIANVFGEHTDLSVGRHRVPYIAPQDVQDATHVRILLAKDAISTGWDCPRAEVMFSLRPAQDRTYITQLLGRMMRTPLARRIESDERLNAVTCFLPSFNRATATDVANTLTGEAGEKDDQDAGSGKGLGRKALTSPKTFGWNPNVPEEIKAFFSDLPSEATPRGQTKPVKRLLDLATAIALDNLMDRANDKAYSALFAVLDGQMAQHRDTVQHRVAEIYTADIRRITHAVADGTLAESTRKEMADDQAVDDAYRAVSRMLGAAVTNGYTKRLAVAADEGDDLDIHSAKAKVAALLAVPGVTDVVEREAENVSDAWLNQLRREIKGLSEERRTEYDNIKRQAREPRRVDIVVPKSRIENTEDADGILLPTQEKHLLADENGQFPLGGLNDWELAVVGAELNQDNIVAWYRNPSLAAADALQVPYRLGDKWKSMQPDFIFFSRNHDGSLAASIVDPHGDHLADALPKLQGLAAFAERYGDEFLRIEAISQIDKKELRMLDLTDPKVRQAIQDAASASELYRSGIATRYE
jgi:hypothetical protein